MTREDRALASWDALSVISILLALVLAASFLLFSRNSLAIVFMGYGIILIQSRLHLWCIITGFHGAPTLRRLVRSAVFFLPLPFLGPPVLAASSWGIAAGVAYGCLFLLLRLPELRLNLSPELLSILPPLSREDRIRETFHPILAAIAQEYFYRGVLLYSLAAYIGAAAIAVSALLFTLEHAVIIDARKTFDRRDYLFHTLLGLGLGGVFYYSESLLGCMLGHAIYNAPSVIQVLRRESAT
jgi:membrane protease YdiL (CAAX protease family)